jgi:hypothetical protein
MSYGISERILEFCGAWSGKTIGDYAEIGSLPSSFPLVVRAARKLKKVSHAFDSFEGMGDPNPTYDMPEGKNPYPKGKFTSGGVLEFERRILAAGVQPNEYHLHPGYIPDCFKGVSDWVMFAFVWLDVDHHDPTKLALEWVWPRIAIGGILGLDDYFPGRPHFATPAIEEFLEREQGKYKVLRDPCVGNQLLLLKQLRLDDIGIPMEETEECNASLTT